VGACYKGRGTHHQGLTFSKQYCSIYIMKSETNKCPLCNQPIEVEQGTRMNRLDGITVGCTNEACEMADWGHGRNEAAAFEIFKQKCGV
jgi:hypothetical protein